MSLARRYARLPAPGAMLKLVQASETALEESALDFYEKSNLTWRSQYTNPSLARLGIGTEFLPAKSKRQKSSTSGDTESENQQNGNRTYRIYHVSEFLDYLPEIDSDYENLVPTSTLTPNSNF